MLTIKEAGIVTGEADMAVLDELFAGDGEMFSLMRSLDWAATPVGPVSGWPQSLRTAVSICLGSRHPIEIWWGPQYLRFYNDAYRPILGQSKHPQFLGRPGQECWAEIWDVIGPMLDSVRATGIPTWSEDFLLMVTRNGYIEETYFTFSYSPIRDESGSVGGIFCACTETTGRVLGERRLRTLRELAAHTAETKTVEEACRITAETLSKNTADISFALLYLVEANGLRAHLEGTAGIEAGTTASPRYVDLTLETAGWPLALVRSTGKAELVDLTTFGALPGGTWSESPHSALVMPIAQSGRHQQLVGLLVVGISPRREFDDDYRGFFDLVASNVATAIANARAYEEERKRAEALFELDRAKTTFFSNVSHEFRTPLTLMLGPLEDTLAVADDELPAYHRQTLEMVHRNSLRLLKLVNNLLDFSRIEAGRVQAVYQPTDLAAYTVELASAFRSAIEQAALSFIVDCPPLTQPVCVDREMWEKIVLNLLSNAFKFTFEGQIAVRLHAVGDFVELTVQDTGIGIPAEELPRLFERFHRVSGVRARTHEGSGIGLALVQELVKLHAGTIRVSSFVGEGTTFTVAIPPGSAHLPAQIAATRNLQSTVGAASYIEEALSWLPEKDEADLSLLSEAQNLWAKETGLLHPAKARILLAEDNADMRNYVKRLLSQYYEVEAVADGVAALETVRQQLPDLILSDVMMPRIDGFGLLRELRADPRTREVPIILLSARAGEESRVEGIEAGANDYLIKPFSARELLARVGTNLEMARLRQESLQREQVLRAAAEMAREQVIESEAKYRFLAEGMPLFVWTSLPEGGADYCNQYFREYTGLTLEQAGDSGWISSLHTEDVEHTLERWYKAKAAGESYEIEYRFRRAADSTYRWYLAHIMPVRDESGQVVKWIGTAIDIDDRKRTEDERTQLLIRLQQYASQLRGLTKAALVMNSALSIAEVLQAITEQARSIIGAHQAVTSMTVDQWEQAITSVSFSDKYAAWRDDDEKPDDSDIYAPVCHLNRPMRMTQAELEAQPNWRGFGKSVHHPPMRGWLAAPLTGRDGHNMGSIQLSDKYEGEFTEADEAILVQLAQMASVAIENTRLYEAEQNARARAEAANRIKDEFLAVLSHELRSPLNPILGWSKLLRTRKFDEAKTAYALETIERNAKLQSQLIEDLLDVSRILQGKLSLESNPVNLQSTIEAAQETVRLAAEAKSIQLTSKFEPNVGQVLGDSNRLQQIVWNLLSNAVKFTPSGGRVEVRLYVVSGQLSAVNGSKQPTTDNYAQIQVSDTGKGINPEFLPYVFDSFRQADSSTTRVFGGLGLGLAIVRHLVELHGGTVFAESPGAGLGATFTVRLPMMAVVQHKSEVNQLLDSLNLEGVSILVVDDDVDSLEFIAFLLEQYGAKVYAVKSALEALEVLAQSQLDLLVSDVGMPEVDGYMLMRQIRALPKEQGGLIPAIALTAYAGETDHQQVLLAGFQKHVTKPVEPADLAVVIAKLLGLLAVGGVNF